MTQTAMVRYWIDGAQEVKDLAFEVADIHIDWSFFFWHLAIEKLLKGLLVQQNLPVPVIHDLPRLADKLNLQLNDDQKLVLAEVTTYNIKARYDDYKKEFYKKVTISGYKQLWFPRCEEMYIWIKKLYQ